MKPLIQKFTQKNPNLVELYTTVNELHELFLKNKQQGVETMVDLRIKEVNIVDFFKSLHFFNTQTKCPVYKIKGPQGETLAYCYHYRPVLEHDFSVMIVSEIHEKFKYKDFKKHPIGPINYN